MRDTLGGRLTRAREEAGLRIGQSAKILGQSGEFFGLSRSELHRIENDQIEIQEQLFKEMVELYGINKIKGGVEWLQNGGVHPIDKPFEEIPIKQNRKRERQVDCGQIIGWN